MRLPVCASEAYLRCWSDDHGWFESDAFALPFFVARRGGFRQMVFTSQTLLRSPGASVESERAFLDGVVALARRTRAQVIGQPRTTSLFRTAPEGAIAVDWGTYRADLSPGEDALFAGLHRHHRRVIRKAIRDGVTVHSGADRLGACHGLIRETLRRERKPCLPEALLRRFAGHLGDGVSFYVASLDGESQAAALLISDAERAYYLVGGRRPGAHPGASALLHWTAMRDMKRRGVAEYDFVGGRVRPVRGSKQEGIQLFKSRFGTRFHRGVLWKHPLRPLHHGALRTMGRAKDFLGRSRYNEDMIDNELRTRHLPRSDLVP